MEVLAPAPADHILEVGCGPGVAAELILQRLTIGKLTAIDRSVSAIAAAERRHRSAIVAGKTRFLNVALEKADFGGDRFDRVLAVHVNRFWLKPADESGLWAPLLKPGAEVCLVYEPPAESQTPRVVDACSDYLRRSGFADVRVRRAEYRAIPAVCISGRWTA